MAGVIILLGALLLASTYWLFLLPPHHPRNVPAVPFWVALIPFFKDVDQSEIFKNYIEGPLRRHGAVKLFFGAQWNLLVHRPSYLTEIFKDEDVYQKTGNHRKIPHSVLADFLGDNIISSRSETWKTYRSVIRPGLQRNFEVDILERNASLLCGMIETAQKHAGVAGIPVQAVLQRYSVANCAGVLLQTELRTLTQDNVALNTLQMSVKREIFKPIFMNFPFLDRLSLPSRKRARNMVVAFKNELKDALKASHTEDCEDWLTSDKLGSRLLGAVESGLWSEKQFLDNLTVTFVAGQENPQLLMISTLYLLAKHPRVQNQLLHEICCRAGTSSIPSPTDFHDMPLMTSVIYESLRLFPPIGQLINRRAATDAVLGGDIFVPRGTYLGYNCYSTNRDTGAWGPTADDFRPERWGDSSGGIQKQYRLRRARGEFISFHGGKRACLGEKFAMLEMRVTLSVLVRRFHWSLDPLWVDRKTPAGPLYPMALRLVFDSRQSNA